MAKELGTYFEDFVVGSKIGHALSKTIFESDNNLFSLLTMNLHPLHTNQDYASTQQHKDIVVVGTLVFSLAVGITVADVSGKAIANLGYQDIEHLAPVFVGDTIYVSTEILGKRASKSKGDRGVVTVKSLVVNQKEELVLTFSRRVLVKKREVYAS
jgi:acyl dehydratase